MNRTRARRATKILLASMLAAVLLVPGLAAASPTDEIDELVDDVEYYVNEWLPRIVFEDVPWIIDWYTNNPPDPQELVEAVSYPQPEEVPELLFWAAEQAPYWAEHFSRAPSRVVVTIDHERTDDDRVEIVKRDRVSYRGDPDGRGGRTYTSVACDGPTWTRVCNLAEDVLGSPASPSEVTVARHTQRTSTDIAVSVRAGATFQDSSLDQDHAVTTPKITCASTAACDAVESVLD